MTKAAFVDLACRVIDTFRPRHPLDHRESFQFRFLTGCALLGLFVSIPSLAIALLMSQGLAVLVIGLFSVGLIGLLMGIRTGASLSALGWYGILLVGGFLMCESLITAEFEERQLSWLALLPMCSLILGTAGQIGEKRISNQMTIWSVGLIATLIGAFIVIAHHCGWTAGQALPPYTRVQRVVAMLLDYALFIASITGLLWVYHLAIRKAEGELSRLRHMFSVCAWCKRIKDKQEGWISMEQHLSKTNPDGLTHGICPDCLVAMKREF